MTNFSGDATSGIHTAGALARHLRAERGRRRWLRRLRIAGAISDKVAVSLSFGGSGGDGADGGVVTAGSAANPLRGSISTTGAHSYGVLAQSVGGGGGNGGLAIAGSIGGKGGAALSFGGDGGGGGAGSSVFLTSQSLISTRGNDSHGCSRRASAAAADRAASPSPAASAATESFDLSFGGPARGGGSAGAVALTSQRIRRLPTRGDHVLRHPRAEHRRWRWRRWLRRRGQHHGRPRHNFGIGGGAGRRPRRRRAVVNSSAIVTARRRCARDLRAEHRRWRRLGRLQRRRLARQVRWRVNVGIGGAARRAATPMRSRSTNNGGVFRRSAIALVRPARAERGRRRRRWRLQRRGQHQQVELRDAQPRRRRR